MLASDKAVDGTPIATLTKGSTKFVLVACNDCSKQSEIHWNNYVQGQRKRGWTGETYCQPCIARRIGKSSRGTVNAAVSKSNRQRAGEQHPSWKGGRYIDHHGYVMVNVRSGRNGDSGWTNYRKEHFLVMEEHLGRELQPGEVVHHIDGDKTNNLLTNLWLTDQGGHRTAHISLQGIGFLLVRAELVRFDSSKSVYVADRKLRELLEHPESLEDHNVAGNGKREGVKTVEDWAISSQASGEPEEGSTTRSWSPNALQGNGR